MIFRMRYYTIRFFQTKVNADMCDIEFKTHLKQYGTLTCGSSNL